MKTKTSVTRSHTGAQPQESPAKIDSAAQSKTLGIIKSETPYLGMGALPELCTPFAENKITVLVEHGTGNYMFIPDFEYANNGAEIFDNEEEIIGQADVILKTSPITTNELQRMSMSQIMLAPFNGDSFTQEDHDIIVQKKITAIAYNFIKNKSGQTQTEFLANKNYSDEIARQKEFTEFLTNLLNSIIFNNDVRTSIQTNPEILQGTYYYKGLITNREIAKNLNIQYNNILELCWNWN